MATFSLVHGAWLAASRSRIALRIPTSSSPRSSVARLTARLRRQVPYDAAPAHVERPAYIVCARDASIRTESRRHLARDVLDVEQLELDASHSPMLECPRELADLLDDCAP